VVLSGGVFQSALLTREASARLRGEGFRVYRHRLVPPNDGGLSLGQLAVAAACLAGAKPQATGSGDSFMEAVCV
jgi:hydrogenase maturation protein HypF